VGSRRARPDWLKGLGRPVGARSGWAQGVARSGWARARAYVARERGQERGAAGRGGGPGPASASGAEVRSRPTKARKDFSFLNFLFLKEQPQINFE
jgi:hypothetical protein